MNRICRFFLSATLLLGASGPAFAQELEKVREDFSEKFPRLTVTEFSKSPIAGFYEVVVEDQVLYYFSEGYLMAGELWSPEGKNLTAEKKDHLASAKLNNLPLDKAIKIGDGPHVVIEFTDPSCPYCKRTEDFFAGREDITRYVFFYPGQRDSAAKAQYALCSQDKPSAVKDIFDRNFSVPAESIQDSCDAKTLVNEHIEAARLIGVRGTPALWVNGTAVRGADLPRIESLLR